MTQETLKLALEALTYIYTETTADEDELIHAAITALREALAQRKPLTHEEIFACENSVPDEIVTDRDWCIHFARAIEAAVLQTRWPMKNWKENKTTPPQRKPWVGLTDDEIQAVAKQARSKDHAVTLTNQFLRGKNL